MSLDYAAMFVCWTVAYLLILAAGAADKTVSHPAIPLSACAFNFAWEVNAALVENGYWVFVVWAALDVGILLFCLLSLKTPKKRLEYGLFCLLALVGFYGLFRLPGGAFWSSFVLALYMAVAFLLRVNELDSRFQLSIGVLKLLGDLFAGIVGTKRQAGVAALAGVELICNIVYVAWVLRRRRQAEKERKKHKKCTARSRRR